MSVINDLTGDQRVHRIASTLQQQGYEVWVIGRLLPDSAPLPSLPYHTVRMRLLFKKGKAFYIEYNIRLLYKLLFSSCDILHANDLDTMLANFLVSRISRKPLVYDAHEYFTEVPELLDRPFAKGVWKILEKKTLPRLRYMFTVNQSIADLYIQAYGISVAVVRNLPYKKEPEARKKGYVDNRILIYQGALNKGRGIELMIAAMGFLPDFTLWIVGKGDIEEELHEFASRQMHPERIVFKGFVPFQELGTLTQQAVLGFSLEEDLGANYRYASPNKIFDYIQAGIPVLVSDLPEMKRIVTQYKVGEVLKRVRRTPRALASQILSMVEDAILYTQYKNACKKAGQVLTWENERNHLLDLYHRLEKDLGTVSKADSGISASPVSSRE